MTQAAEDLLARAKRNGVQASHVLMDSWFGTPAVVTSCAKHFHVISMVKKTPKVYYGFNDNVAILKDIYKTIRKRPGKAKWLADTLVTLKTGLPARLIFLRNHTAPKNWIALLTTDMTTAPEEIVRLYGMRWDIEVFFRTIKQNLAFTHGFQGRDFDSIIGHCTIVTLRYIFLSMEQRQKKDPRTLGRLFEACCKELKDVKTYEAVHRIIGLAIEQFPTQDTGKGSRAEFLAEIQDLILAVALDYYGFSYKNKPVRQQNAA